MRITSEEELIECLFWDFDHERKEGQPERDAFKSVMRRFSNHIHANALPWWRKDAEGWPIELIEGELFGSVVRLVVQNLRKLPGLRGDL